ncbi:PilZ domain-containing protein [bacterium]|nr:PilZ domain-containing protein [bacterium]
MVFNNNFIQFAQLKSQTDGSDRRTNPRYSINFLTKNTIVSAGMDTVVYDGLVTIENISARGMCVRVKETSPAKFNQYKQGKKLLFTVNLFFSGKILRIEGRVAWADHHPDRQTGRLGLDFNESLGENDTLITYFEQEKNMQEAFYLNIK